MPLPLWGHDKATLSTMVFAAIVLMQMANAFECRSNPKSLFPIGPLSPRLLVEAVAIEAALLLILVYLPPVQNVPGEPLARPEAVVTHLEHSLDPAHGRGGLESGGTESHPQVTTRTCTYSGISRKVRGAASRHRIQMPNLLPRCFGPASAPPGFFVPRGVRPCRPRQSQP